MKCKGKQQNLIAHISYQNINEIIIKDIIYMFGNVEGADTLCTYNSSINWDRILESNFAISKLKIT